ncbi:MAG: ATP-dependent RecD-like DNA helicase [Defluviitaleaceae bacterium]|nr:ATP-dependent RecD-like DNA helicase [Defluviitaleaceae bacterium]
MDKLNGVVERITYSDEEKGYSVIKVNCQGYNDLITFVGNMASINIGAVVSVSGTWVNNAKYGRQFNVSTWEERIPAGVHGIEKYLGSGLIKGVGSKFAKEIVNLFKEQTLEIIENEPHRLIEVPKIGKKRVAMIQKAWHEQKEIKNIMIFLQEYGVSTAFGYRIYKAYGDQSITIVKENPYKLADDIWGIGFKTADQIAEKLGMEKESFHRCRAGLFYTLNQFANDGHCYAHFDDLVIKSVEILDIEQPKIHMALDYLIKNNELKMEPPSNVYLPPFFYSESGVARRVNQLMKADNHNTLPNFETALIRLQEKLSVNYDDVQVEAIKLAVSSKFCVITGGPGTGKTTTTKAIIELFKLSSKEVLLAAPTGRAAKRMSEATGMETKTIHRLLESKPPQGFGRNTDNPLEGDVLVLDECSMIDILLMYNLLKAVPDTMTVIMVGDIDQLPAVGAGSVLGDIIKSGVVPVVRLTRIFRQSLGSKIITNAHKINSGKMPELSGGKDSDFFFISMAAEDKSAIINEIVKLCAERLPKYYRINPITDIQVLTPMRRSETGADNLNRMLQAALNPNTICLRRGVTEYRVGDKVMQVKNNYDKDIYNGDIGVITKVNTEDKVLTVNFDGNDVEYDVLELDELVLSYAITVHKSQGGEFPIVVIPFTMSHYVMLQRNLLYTGVTRAKKAVIIIGEKKAVAYAVKNADSNARNTMLAERLIGVE